MWKAGWVFVAGRGVRGAGGEINRNRMARVGAGRSSEAEKNT